MLLVPDTTAIWMIPSLLTACHIARQRPGLKTMLIHKAALPCRVSITPGVWTWIIILGKDGLLGRALTGLGLKTEPGGFLFGNLIANQDGGARGWTFRAVIALKMLTTVMVVPTATNLCAAWRDRTGTACFEPGAEWQGKSASLS